MNRRFFILLTLFYLAGVVIQFLYVPYIARVGPQQHFVSQEANYSWRWNSPVYFNVEKMENVYLSDVEEWKAKDVAKTTSYSKNNWLLDELYKKPNDTSFPNSWLSVYGIDYKRLMMSFVAWTVLVAGAGFVGKHFS